MKLNLTVFLIKEGLAANEFLQIKGHRNHVELKINNIDCDLYWKSKTSKPKWVDLFKDIDGLNTEIMKGKSLQGILTFKINERYFCFTFGHARHFIDPLSVERYFGLKTALNLSDPSLIKSIDKTNIDKTPFRSRTQAAKYVSISEFEFKFDWEILKSLTGIIETDSDEEYEVISGADSVSLFTDITLQDIPVIAERLFEAYQANSYKEKYPWIDYIVPVRDKHLVSTLDGLLIEKLNSGNYEDVWAAPPDIISYDNFSGFCYKKRNTGNSSQTTHPDLDIESCIKDKNITGEVTVSKLKTTKIYLLDGNDHDIAIWPLYICLNAEIEHEQNTYLLSEGSWYQIARDFVTQINRHFSEFPHSDIELPSYNGLQERQYLERISDDNRNFYLLDKKLINLDGAASPFEFCDLLTPNNELIHVKKYSSSSVLSHFFSQAYVSAESLLRTRQVIDQVNRYLSEITTHRFQFDASRQPRQATIILAIMQKKPGNLHMPFFSKVNFRQYSQRLIDMGYRVLLKKIDL